MNGDIKQSKYALVYLAGAVARKNLRQIAWENNIDENNLELLLSDIGEIPMYRAIAAEMTIEELKNRVVIDAMKVPGDLITGNYIKALTALMNKEHNASFMMKMTAQMVAGTDAFVRLIQNPEEDYLPDLFVSPNYIKECLDIGKLIFDVSWDSVHIADYNFEYLEMLVGACGWPVKATMNELTGAAGIWSTRQLDGEAGHELEEIGYMAGYFSLRSGDVARWLTTVEDHGKRNYLTARFADSMTVIDDEGHNLLLTGLGLPTQSSRANNPLIKSIGSFVPGGLHPSEYQLAIDLARDVAAVLLEYNEPYRTDSFVEYADKLLLTSGFVTEENHSGNRLLVNAVVCGRVNKCFEETKHGETNFAYARMCYLIRHIGHGVFEDLLAMGCMDKHNASAGNL